MTARLTRGTVRGQTGNMAMCGTTCAAGCIEAGCSSTPAPSQRTELSAATCCVHFMTTPIKQIDPPKAARQEIRRTCAVLERRTCTAKVRQHLYLGATTSSTLVTKHKPYLHCLGEEDVDGEGAAGDLEDGHAAEEVGELFGVQRGCKQSERGGRGAWDGPRAGGAASCTLPTTTVGGILCAQRGCQIE